jgi:hypothetical protein
LIIEKEVGCIVEKCRIDQSKGQELGLYTIGDHIPNPQTGERISAEQRSA